MDMEREYAEFAKRLGLSGFSFSENGVASLVVENVGQVFFEKNEQERERVLLVYLARQYDVYEKAMPEKVLRFCSYAQGHNPPLYGSCVKDMAILGVRLDEETFTAVSLENTIYYLAEKMQKLFAD